MELWKVKIQYQDPSGKEPIRKRTYYAAVYGAFGSDQAQKAGNLALTAVVETKDYWTAWQAFVVSAEYVGSVVVENESDKK